MPLRRATSTGEVQMDVAFQAMVSFRGGRRRRRCRDGRPTGGGILQHRLEGPALGTQRGKARQRQGETAEAQCRQHAAAPQRAAVREAGIMLRHWKPPREGDTIPYHAL
jgi:hypothetical protein